MIYKTDAEVKKDLECYRGQKLFAFNGKKPEIYIHDIIDLINSQEAEIKHLDIESDVLRADVENLNRINDELNAENESLKAEVERLQNAYKQCAWERDIFAEDMTQEIKKDCSYLMLDIKTIKAEAYKECIEKVRNLAVGMHPCSDELRVFDSDLDNLLNELVGDGDGKRKD